MADAETQSPPVAPAAKPETKVVPIGEVLKERHKRQSLEAELKAANEQLAKLQKAPDPAQAIASDDFNMDPKVREQAFSAQAERIKQEVTATLTAQFQAQLESTANMQALEAEVQKYEVFADSDPNIRDLAVTILQRTLAEGGDMKKAVAEASKQATKYRILQEAERGEQTPAGEKPKPSAPEVKPSGSLAVAAANAPDPELAEVAKTPMEKRADAALSYMRRKLGIA